MATFESKLGLNYAIRYYCICGNVLAWAIVLSRIDAADC